ncbi:MAG: ABC transporter permease [Defluviitaleaceae bacterium]|nr:ABC transporter permease [Defluviitaleaceae bacterium]
MTIFKFALLRNLRSPVSYLAGLMVPVVLIFSMTSVWTNAPVMGMANLVMLMLLSSNLLVALVLEDRIDGSIMKIMISPVSMVHYVFQNLLAAIIPFVIQIALLGIMGYLHYNWAIQFTIGAVVALFICGVTTAAFSFCWNMFFKSKSSSRYAFLFVMALILLLSGVLVPIEALPGLLQHAGAILHPYWFIRAVITLAEYGMTAQFWLYNTIVLLIGTGFLLLGGKAN